MKKNVISLFLLCSFIIAQAQTDYKVSTIKDKKNILLEEFSGITCKWCPLGHEVADVIWHGLKKRAYIVTMHAGFTAVPIEGSPDYKTEEGDILAKFFESEDRGYPCGMVNRHMYGEHHLFGREYWTNMVYVEHREMANLNLYAESEYDDKTRELKIHVEGYNLEDNSSKDMKLKVLLTQDNVIGPQYDGELREDYNHMHMLRDYVTELEGDVVENKEKGSYFAKDYTYIVPETIDRVDVKPEDLNIITFVTDGELTEVMNVTGCKPVYKNFEYTPSGEISEPDFEVTPRYGFKFFELYLNNRSAEIVKNATFEITINDVKTQVSVDCNVAAFENELISIPCNYEFNEKGIVKYEIKLIATNDNNVESKVLKGKFTRPVVTDGTVKINITTDNCADQNTFTLKDEFGNVIKTFGPYTSGKSGSYEENITLDEEKTYCFEILDEFGDGMMLGCNGSLITHTGSGKLIDQFYKIRNFGARSFFTVDKKMSINDITIENTNNGRIYSLDGRQLDDSTSEKLIIKNGKKQLNINN